MLTEAAAYAANVRRNPFPLVAHAASLGSEVLDVTVRTASFKHLLEFMPRQEAQGEPLAIVVLGPAGAGKTHFLKYLEHVHKNRAESSKDGERSDTQQMAPFDRVLFVPSPGNSFSEFVRHVIRSLLDAATFGLIVDRLVAFPARQLCLEKARHGEETDANNQVAELLKSQPREIETLWSRFSKSEIYNGALKSLEQISQHLRFRETLSALLRARRDGTPVDYELAVGRLVDTRLGGEGGEANSATPSRDFEAVKIAWSLLVLLDLVGVRLLLMVDECQLLLRARDPVAENELFRQLVNATPRGSVTVFALRTDDWLRFADDASTRRVRFQKLSVSPKEAWDIIISYVVVKGGNPILKTDEARRFFPEEAVRWLWSEVEGVIGKVLALCFEVHQRITAEPSEESLIDIAREVARNARSALTSPPTMQDVSTSFEETVRRTCALAGRMIRKGTPPFTYEVLDQEAAKMSVVVALHQAANDFEEAARANDLGKAIVRLRETPSSTRILVAAAGYRSIEVTDLLRALSDRLVILNDSSAKSGPALADALEGLIRDAEGTALKPFDMQEAIQWVDELGAIMRRRAAENARLLKVEPSRSMPELAPLRSGCTWQLTVAAIVMTALFSLLWLQMRSEQTRRAEAAAAKYKVAINEILSGKPATTALAVGDLRSILSGNPELRNEAKSALVTYLRFAFDPESFKPTQEVSLLEHRQWVEMRQEIVTALQWINEDRGLTSPQVQTIDLHGMDLHDTQLDELDLHHANLQYCNLDGASLRFANLEDADLRGASVRRTDLTGADLSGAKATSLAGACGSNIQLHPGQDTATLLPCKGYRR